MLNKVIIQGRCGNDPELRTTNSGVEVATVDLAVDRDRKSKDGNRETDWITVVAWRETAKFLSRYFTKGRMAVVEGRLQMRSYTDKDGNKRKIAEVLADNIYFADSKSSDYAPPKPDEQTYSAPKFEELDDSDTLPF